MSVSTRDTRDLLARRRQSDVLGLEDNFSFAVFDASDFHHLVTLHLAEAYDFLDFVAGHKNVVADAPVESGEGSPRATLPIRA